MCFLIYICKKAYGFIYDEHIFVAIVTFCSNNNSHISGFTILSFIKLKISWSWGDLAQKVMKENPNFLLSDVTIRMCIL